MLQIFNANNWWRIQKLRQKTIADSFELEKKEYRINDADFYWI